MLNGPVGLLAGFVGARLWRNFRFWKEKIS